MGLMLRLAKQARKVLVVSFPDLLVHYDPVTVLADQLHKLRTGPVRYVTLIYFFDGEVNHHYVQKESVFHRLGFAQSFKVVG